MFRYVCIRVYVVLGGGVYVKTFYYVFGVSKNAKIRKRSKKHTPKEEIYIKIVQKVVFWAFFSCNIFVSCGGLKRSRRLEVPKFIDIR